MPGRNGTGPLGMGPKTGAGRGRCGNGRGNGPGNGRGFSHTENGRGNGFGRRVCRAGYAVPENAVKERLQEEETFLRARLAAVAGKLETL